MLFGHEVDQFATARASEQPEFPVACYVQEELQQVVWIGRVQPQGFVHALRRLRQRKVPKKVTFSIVVRKNDEGEEGSDCGGEW